MTAHREPYADAYYVLSRSASKEEVKKALAATLGFFLVVGPYAASLRVALKSDWDDIEDYPIAHSARRSEAQFFITRDRKLADCCPVKALTAAEFLRYWEDEEGLAYDEVFLPAAE